MQIHYLPKSDYFLNPSKRPFYWHIFGIWTMAYPMVAIPNIVFKHSAPCAAVDAHSPHKVTPATQMHLLAIQHAMRINNFLALPPPQTVWMIRSIVAITTVSFVSKSPPGDLMASTHSPDIPSCVLSGIALGEPIGAGCRRICSLLNLVRVYTFTATITECMASDEKNSE